MESILWSNEWPKDNYGEKQVRCKNGNVRNVVRKLGDKKAMSGYMSHHQIPVRLRRVICTPHVGSHWLIEVLTLTFPNYRLKAGKQSIRLMNYNFSTVKTKRFPACLTFQSQEKYGKFQKLYQLKCIDKHRTVFSSTMNPATC